MLRESACHCDRNWRQTSRRKKEREPRNCVSFRCRNEKAKEYYEKALAIAIEIGDRKEEGIINANLGAVFYSAAENQKAMKYCEKALAIAIEIGDRKVEGMINLLANIRRLENVTGKRLPLR